MDDPNPLGDYLKARRELVQPADVGIQSLGLRRVPGLRREEVAMLAGISSDYYLRLEQGRDRNPSVQVLEALARVLQLDSAGVGYLVQLAQQRPRRAPRARRESVPSGILTLLDSLDLPAFVEGRYFDVLASNPLAEALSPGMAKGANRMRAFFLDQRERDLYAPHWEQAAGGLVASFRASVGTDTTDPGFAQLVGELSLGSEAFRKLWARHDVKVPDGGSVMIRHPQVGDLVLRREKLVVREADGMLLVIHHADPGSEAWGLLGLLRQISAGAESVGQDATARPADGVDTDSTHK
ncbi:XRE family transcriptional regulator [Frondihabitans sp. PAMC 28766]|uniref:helix-turn-helix domain-containing protein n=1 Tax=Frondihabitans sp. PAMC 28766 TaxID=1795630 RepID=UPI00078C5E18|nr:helix-turn-helix transcriptional regulator [Frondihabitans sp. PAMC 28766]AMM19327.1 XRE family transcriptional regulator [Frondihabitans sp. PAMC 28766]